MTSPDVPNCRNEAGSALQTSIPPSSGFLLLPLGGVGQRFTTSAYPVDGDEQMLWAAQDGIRPVQR